MTKALWEKLKESMISVLPVVLIVLAVSFTPLVNLSVKEITVFIICSVFLILGIGLFNLGADMAMTPMGEYMGTSLTKSGKAWLLLGVCFIMGCLITIAEPDLSVLAGQVSNVMNETTLILTVGIGVALFLVVSLLKMIFKSNLSMVLMLAYMLMFAIGSILCVNEKSMFIPLSFDSGGVTTGPVTVPFIMALGVGIAMTIGGNKAEENSFGMIALCSVGPMLAVMFLSLFSNGELTYTLADYSMENALNEGIFTIIGSVSIDVLKALLLITVIFFILELILLKLPKTKVIQILSGIGYTFFGLVIFLSAVEIGFMPMGYKLGNELATSSSTVVVIFGFVIGAVVVLAEPAVHVLNHQVESVTGGSVKKKSMMIALSVGVGISIGLSVIRIVFGFSVLYYLVPGYFISLALSLFVPGIYTAIAFDSGGVASGPLTSSFILPLAIGASVALHGESEVMNLAFGVVAMVAMTPLITIQLLGFRAIASKAVRKRISTKRILDADDEHIIYFNIKER